MDNNGKPAVLSISSHVTRGSVGNRASVFVLEAFGFPVWAAQTILLPWHPGHGPGSRIVPDNKVFSTFMDDLLRSPNLGEIGAVLTGYMANASQVDSISRLISSLRRRNPNLVYLCDPVIGDNGQLYVEPKTAEAIRDQLVPKADILTPNHFELAWLTNRTTPETLEKVVEQARETGAPKLLITSVPCASKDVKGSMYIDGTECWHAFHDRIDGAPNGLGDLTAAAFLARSLLGYDAFTNISKTTASVLEVLTQTTKRGSDELTLESSVANLLEPTIAVETIKVSISP